MVWLKDWLQQILLCPFLNTLSHVLSCLQHCVKNIRIRSYSDPYFPAVGLNTDQNNSKYGHFSRSASFQLVDVYYR